MTTQLIAHPFRQGLDGSIQTFEQNDDEYLAERLALLVGCHPGERPLVPAFGINDPAFEGLTLAAIQNQVSIYGLPITITELRKQALSNGVTQYRITFDKKQEPYT